jgi:site-specific DNA-cytosine methylase
MPNCHVMNRDIRKFSLARNVAVDLLVADTPCQPYSSSGKGRGDSDERDLLGTVIDMTLKIRPRAFLFSNVPGLTFSSHAETIERCLGRLLAGGYCVCRHHGDRHFMMNGADFGLPQRRRRPWWFAHLGGHCIAWPSPTHDECDLFLPRWRTIGEAMIGAFGPDLQIKDIGRLATIAWKDGTDHRPSEWDQTARTMTRNANGDAALLRVDRGHPPALWDQTALTVMSKQDHSWYLHSKKHPPSKWDKPALTILGRQRGGSGLVQVSAQHVVVLNEEARKVLQGFPSDWIVTGDTSRSRDSQIGLAMPPTMARPIATSVKEWFDEFAKRCSGLRTILDNEGRGAEYDS